MWCDHVRVASIFRDGAEVLPRYIAQVESLGERLWAEHDVWIDVVVLEGDSIDDTWQLLKAWQRESKLPIQTLKFSHGGPKYPSINKPDRWQRIASCWNYLLEWGRHDFFDAFLYVEGDLIWEPGTMIRLLERLKDIDGVAPMSMLGPDFFYDTWGHRADGLNFTNGRPFHPWLAPGAQIPPEAQREGMLAIDSAGSCLALKPEIVKRCTFRPQDAMIGPVMKERGYQLWLDPALSVRHP